MILSASTLHLYSFSHDQQTGVCSQFFETVKTFNLSIVFLGQFLDDPDWCQTDVKDELLLVKDVASSLKFITRN